ncbi:polysaccharide biosynthesis protein [Rhodohalobacter sulfatireducens]|uniref:Polysaccharide biosynthesis protein n=1 Tax=Rhodohalobacter sulfatireducens TaxID=2911366 RepID=A0ABS9KHU1_9BACT|nr:nucleoside-diphosphate sugar epimerase/dehydratase [Rhodohalobacter sulfatireducens]MCG2590424.1 polysaccharide biosynthesis protein [Rhodohalobacter sulfatireducens]
MLKRIIDQRDFWKFFLELGVWTSITIVAFALRLEGEFNGYIQEIVLVTAVLAVFKAISIYLFGTFRQSWRNIGFRDLFSLLKSISLVSILFLASAFLLRNEFVIPYSVPVIEYSLSLLILSGMRVSTRFYLVYWNPTYVRKKGKNKYRVLIAGAGESGNMAAREMFRHPQAGMHPVAFLDDDKSKQEQKFLGIPVVGTIDDMEEAVKKYKIDEILIAMPSESGEVIRRVVEQARKTDAKYRIIPSIYDLISGKVSINQIRDVDVEDLLRRKPVELNTGLIKDYTEGKTILVTGAGGSIGSEIVRQLSRFNPGEVVLMGRGENSIHQLINEINYHFSNLNYAIEIGDVRDSETLERLFKKYEPQVVFHAAAHKHVPLMEANPEQAIFNNVCGTRNLVQIALEFNVTHFVNISTDKAVNPTSVMGATKRISEQIVQWGANQTKNGEVFVSVRFGNVLGSRGSVIPKFKEQIKRGGPISITHPDMVRYFMTIPEASQLVMQAGALNMNGSVFVLDMGEPVSIETMARDLITLSGFEPDKDIEIEYTGMRPGEKLFEELLTAEEGTDMTQHEKIYVAKSIDVINDLSNKLDQLEKIASGGNHEQIKSAIKDIVPTYQFEAKEVLNY